LLSRDSVTTFSAKAPRKLVAIPEDIAADFFDVSPDGRRFVLIQRDPLELRPLDLVIVPSWVDEMKARLASVR
jgi:hypothetical protein